jgi:uncharacterized protein YjbJ (UPF0337 family)
MNKDELKGKAEAWKGKFKQATADMTDDERLRNEGEADEFAGRAQEGYGRARRKIGEKIKDVGDAIKK